MNNLEKTTFLNQATFSEDEIKEFYKIDKRTFVVWFFTEYEDCTEPLEVYAVDEESLFEYLKEKYNAEAISNVSEKVTEYFELELPEGFGNE